MCWIHHTKIQRYVLDTPHKDTEVCAGYTTQRYRGMCWIHHIKLERYVLDIPHKDIEVCAGYNI
jgi:hypothetical protein